MQLVSFDDATDWTMMKEDDTIDIGRAQVNLEVNEALPSSDAAECQLCIKLVASQSLDGR